MELNIPKSTAVSHELPIFKQMAKEGNIPVSEVKARFRNEMLDLHKKAMDDPSTLPLGANSQDMAHIAVNNLRSELAHPEEDHSSDEEEFNELASNDFQAAGADAFADTGDAFDDFGASGGFGGGGFGGGDFGGGDLGGGDMGGEEGIDNMDLGFSDDGMASFDSVGEDEGDAAGEVNALSELEPETSESETESPAGDSDEDFGDFGA